MNRIIDDNVKIQSKSLLRSFGLFKIIKNTLIDNSL
jgi:hypothetical protein